MVTVRPDDLPDFEDPPVVETVLSVQFEPVRELRTAHLGLLWNKYRDTFPRTEERSPLDQVLEQFPETPRARLGLRLESYETPPVPRVWFISKKGNEMIQVQADRFIKNWRKEGEGEQYPQYENIKPLFERDFALFLAFLRENQLALPCVNQCEVTYVNHIVSGNGWEDFRDFDKVFTFCRNVEQDVPGNAEDWRAHLRFVIPDPEGKPVGRLHVDVQPAFRAVDDKPMYLFHLTARGQVAEGYGFFDLGRRWIVRSFAALTSPRMHEVWRRKNRGPGS